MLHNISLFPMLTGALLQQIDCRESRLDLEYHDENGQLHPLKLEELSIPGRYNIKEDQKWDFNDYDLIVKKKLVVSNPAPLFGLDGIVCKDAFLGVAIEWMSPQSRQRNTEMSTIDISYNSANVPVEISIPFSKAQLRGGVSFRLILFLKKSGFPSKNEEHFANQVGMILGVLEEFHIEIDGNGSLFPIFEVDEPGNPLWRVKCDWNDPVEDLFNESVALYINKSHPNYRFLDQKNSSYDSQLIIEITAAALTVVVEKMRSKKDYWETTQHIKQSERGSVSAAICYMRTVIKELDLTDVESTLLTMRKYLEKGMNSGN